MPPVWISPPTQSFLQCIDEIKIAQRYPDYPLRVVVYGQKTDTMGGGGTWALAKVEYGTVSCGQELILMPERKMVICAAIQLGINGTNNSTENSDSIASSAGAGENVVLKLSGVDKVEKGSILCSRSEGETITVCKEFIATIRVVSLPAGKKVIIAGYEAVLHAYSLMVDCKIIALASGRSFLKEGESCECKIETSIPICLERSDKLLNGGRDFSKLSRFILRDENVTLAIGKVNRIKELR